MFTWAASGNILFTTRLPGARKVEVGENAIQEVPMSEIRPVGDRPNVNAGGAARVNSGVAAERAGGGRTEEGGGRTRAAGDGAELSDEAKGAEAEETDENPLLQGLKDTKDAEAAKDTEDKKDPQEEKVKELQKQIEEAQEELQKALASGDEEAIHAAAGKLTNLVDELQGLLKNQGGGAQNGGAPPAGGGGAAPAGGGGAPPAGGGGAPPAGGGGAPPMGGGQPPMGGGAPPAGGGAPPAGGNTQTGNAAETRVPPPELSANDQKLASFIEKQLENSPAGGKGLGAHFVAAGRKNEVDPLALVAIAKHETGFGKLGVGIDKMLGVGAYDSNPNGKTPYDGAINQIYSGAKTFANLRAKGGSNAQDSLGVQLSAVNRAGWATDGGWHTKVASHYNNIVARA